MEERKQKDIVKRIPTQLGIRFDDKVWQYMMALVSITMVAPDEMMKRIRILPEIVDYVFPEPRFTQKRVEELFARVEIFCRAARIILDRAGVDFFEKAVLALMEPLRSHLPNGRAPTKTEAQEISAEIARRLEELFESYTTTANPAFRAATRVLFGIDDIFDLDRPAPGPKTTLALGLQAVPKKPRQKRRAKA